MTVNEAKNFHVNTDMFGQYAKIPTGYSEDLHIYKIITRFQSNSYCDVPIIGLRDSTLHKEVTDVLNVIHCGVDESKVIRVALKDCEIIENEEAKELRQYRAIGTVEECRVMESIISKVERNELAKIIDEWLLYRKIGTVEECREAVEKQKAMKPKEILRHRGGFEIQHCPNCNMDYRVDSRYEITDGYCPVCGKLLDSVFKNYCANCGQALIDEN